MDDNIKSFNVDGTEYKTKLTTLFEKRKEWIEPNPGKIYAVIPGTILEIKVKEGDKVKKGDILILLEAMKMRNRVKSPINGTIKHINVSLNQSVAKNALLLEIEY